MKPSQFITKWRKVALTERSAAQQHFLDLCEVFGHQKPAEVDPTGESFTFEKGAEKHGGGEGWADVWKRGYFGWEYKGKHKDLNAAYDQLLKYRASLENPPLLVVCDMDRIIIHTNFTNTAAESYEIRLIEMDTPKNLNILRAVFFDPEKLKPGATRQAITEKAAEQVAKIAQKLRDRGLESQSVARFLDRIVFCLFAEDVGLLPDDLFTKILQKTKNDPAHFSKLISGLFQAMAEGGDFGLETIRHFNGNLFNDAEVLELMSDEIESIRWTAGLDWGAVDPSIFGTLFERGLDPSKRSQLGAHYTSRQDIETLVEPVVMQPLRREWDNVRGKVEVLLQQGKKNDGKKAAVLLYQFHDRLEAVKVLDPACGSGNFLYVTLQKLKDLEKEVMDFAMHHDFSGMFPKVGPWQLYGIEINPYAHDLAQMTIWIGYLQWMSEHGYLITDDPVLRPMDNFMCMDAILDLSDPDNPKEPEWPEVDYIVGNPPFLGGKKMRSELGDYYVDELFKLWRSRVRPEADLCCYWFEKARQQIQDGRCQRAGLLATQGIRGGANRETLKRIKDTGDIFFTESDRPWILDGANVHVSMVGYDNGTETNRKADGKIVEVINSNLSSTADITKALLLFQNQSICFRASEKGGSFDISDEVALQMLQLPNPSGMCCSDVIRPWINSQFLLQQRYKGWIIDFGFEENEARACLYEHPFEYVKNLVRIEREGNRDQRLTQLWWLHRRNAIDMRHAIKDLDRFIVTPRVAKHRIFVWEIPPLLPDNMLSVFARSDDYFFGILHSRLHEVWSRAQGSQLRECESGQRYTPTTCFETFPFPEPSPEQEATIAEAAKELDYLRNNWLNPPEWTKEEVLEFPGSVDGPWSRYVHDPNDNGIGTVRYPRIVPKDDEHAEKLAKRTLTNLYNQRPTWLDLAHKKLDEAVFDAYGWSVDIGDEEILEKLLALNLERAGE